MEDSNFYNCAEIIETDINSLCRICGNTSNDSLLPIFNEDDDELSTRIQFYLPIQISIEDLLPLKICTSCTNNLQTWHNFYEICFEADQRFKKMLTEEQFIIENSSQEKITLEDQEEEEENDNEPDEPNNISNLYESDAEINEEDDPNVDNSDQDDNFENEDNIEENENEGDKPKKLSINSRLIVKCQLCNEEIKDITEKISIYKDFTDLNCEIICDNCKNRKSLEFDTNPNHPIKLNHICEICNEEFHTKTLQRKHISQHEKIICKICNKTFKTYPNLLLHIKIHTDTLSYHNCPICDWRTNRKYNLKIHINSHVNDNYCRLCCLSFNSLQNLEKHKTCHKKSELENYTTINAQINCHNCFEVFQSKLQLYQHIIKSHDIKDKKYECDVCERIFQDDVMLRNHQKSHRKILYECEICGRKFNQLKNLQEHEHTHFDLRPFECHICKKQFKYSSNLCQHMAVHNGEKNYKCMYCEKSFLRSNTFKMHLRIHRNERNYKCEYCNFAFVQSSSLVKHKRSIHRFCKLCGKLVGDKKQWQIHVWKECPVSELMNETNND